MPMKPKKGRNSELIKRRDEALLRRWYYWTEIEMKRFDWTLTHLSLNEFFISEERIMAIVRAKSELLEAIAAKPIQKPRRRSRLVSKQLSLFFTDDQ